MTRRGGDLVTPGRDNGSLAEDEGNPLLLFTCRGRPRRSASSCTPLTAGDAKAVITAAEDIAREACWRQAARRWPAGRPGRPRRAGPGGRTKKEGRLSRKKRARGPAGGSGAGARGGRGIGGCAAWKARNAAAGRGGRQHLGLLLEGPPQPARPARPAPSSSGRGVTLVVLAMPHGKTKRMRHSQRDGARTRTRRPWNRPGADARGRGRAAGGAVAETVTRCLGPTGAKALAGGGKPPSPPAGIPASLLRIPRPPGPCRRQAACALQDGSLARSAATAGRCPCCSAAAVGLLNPRPRRPAIADQESPREDKRSSRKCPRCRGQPNQHLPPPGRS